MFFQREEVYLKCIIIWGGKNCFIYNIDIMGEIPLLNDHFQRWTGRLFSAGKSRRLKNKKWYNLPLSPMALQYLYSFRKFPGYILAKCVYIYGNVYVCICKNMRSQLLWHPLVWYTPFCRVGQPNNPPIHKSEVSLNKDPKWHLHTFALTYIIIYI